MRTLLKRLGLLCLPSLLVGFLLTAAFASEPVPVLELSDAAEDYTVYDWYQSSDVMPISLSTSLQLYGGGAWDSSPPSFTPEYISPLSYSSTWLRARYATPVVSGSSYLALFVGFGSVFDAPFGSDVTIAWSGLDATRYATTLISSSYDPGYSLVAVSSSAGIADGLSWYIYDQDFNVLAGPFGSAGSVTFSLDHSVSSLIFGCFYRVFLGNSTLGSRCRYCDVYVPVSTSELTFTYFVPGSEVALLQTTNSLIEAGNSTLSHIDSDMHQLVTIVGDLQASAAQPSAMEEFENRYLDKMDGQLSQLESMMGPENTTLPNGGDVVGFASDVQDAFGISGSDFSASDLSDALAAFGGSDSIEAGGPWEFFSQSVADSLSGEAAAASLNDDDYVYAWLEETLRRYSMWSSP